MNFKGSALWTALLLLIAHVAAAHHVITATDKTFDDIVLHSGKTSFVKFYADWCGHCKNMAPAYKDLSDIFANSDELQIVEINGDVNRKINGRYDVSGFPTLKLFKKDAVKEPVDYEGGRDLESLQNFITASTGIKGKVLPPPVNHIVSVDDHTFEKEVLQDDKRSHFVVFTASWCGHCKKLKPDWLKLSNVFAHDQDKVVINEILTSDVDSDMLKQKYEIQGFPTILFFGEDKENPELYKGSRKLEGLVSFINSKTGLHRDSNGQLTDKAGLIKDFDVTGLISSEEKISRAQEMLAKLEEVGVEKGAVITDLNYYKKLLNKIISDETEFFQKESTRLEKILLKSENLAQEKIDSMRKRLNIIKAFLEKQIARDEF